MITKKFHQPPRASVRFVIQIGSLMTNPGNKPGANARRLMNAMHILELNL